jgi:hypothetical protein
MNTTKEYMNTLSNELSSVMEPEACHDYVVALWIHITLFNMCSRTFSIKLSDVHGFGVFTNVQVGHRVIVGYYTGKLTVCNTDVPPQSIENSDYIMQTPPLHDGTTHFIDANNPSDCRCDDPTRYVNGCANKNDANVRAEMLDDGVVVLITCALIPANNELFYWYGNNYKLPVDKRYIKV